MNTFRVELGPNSHDVIVGQDLLDRLGDLVLKAGLLGRFVIITDTTVGALYLERTRKALAPVDPAPVALQIEPGEKSKSLATLERVYDELAKAKVDRQSIVVALGGGVVGDLAGFAAATFLRGLRLIQVPTSLLAQVDSALGGKTGINHPAAKNLIGAFYQPRLIVVDTGTLATLPEREFREGLAEMVKYALIRDRPMFEELERHCSSILAREPAVLEKFVTLSLQHKARIVESDEREGDIRALLNFGHTVGHALEAESEFRGLLHGEAVAIGMVAEARISQNYAGLDSDELARLKSWLEKVGLPVDLPDGIWQSQKFITALGLDKKRAANKVRLVLLRRIGEATIENLTLEALINDLRRFHH